MATHDKNEAVHVAESRAHDARMAVAQLKEAVAHGLKNDQSIQTPDLITFDESVARALYRYVFVNVALKHPAVIMFDGI